MQSFNLILVLLCLIVANTEACSVFETSLSSNLSFYVTLPTSGGLFEVNFLAYVKNTNSADANNVITFSLSDSTTGAPVYTFPPLTGEMQIAKLVSDTVFPCETDKWPSQLTLNVTFFSSANTTLQVQILCEPTDFFGGKFQEGNATKVQSIIAYDDYYFSFEIPVGETRYDINFSMVGEANANIPFSSFCLSAFTTSCNVTCLYSGDIPPNSKWLWFAIQHWGTGNYSVSFKVNAINTSVRINAIVWNSNNPPATTTTASSQDSTTTSDTGSSTTSTTSSTSSSSSISSSSSSTGTKGTTTTNTLSGTSTGSTSSKQTSTTSNSAISSFCALLFALPLLVIF